MAQLTIGTPLVYSEETRTDFYDYLCDAVNVFQGSALGINSANGTVRQLVAADLFAGFAEKDTQNVSPQTALTKQQAAFAGANPGTGVAGGARINARVEGAVVLNVTTDGTVLVASAVDNIGLTKFAYASDGATYTYLAAGNSLIGEILEFLSVVSGTAGQAGCVAQYLVLFQSKYKRAS